MVTTSTVATASAGVTAAAATTMPIAGARRTFTAIRMALQGSGPRALVAMTILIAAAALGLVTPWGLGQLVDIATDDRSIADLWRYAVVMVIATVMAAICVGAGMALAGSVLETVLARLRERMVSGALAMSPARVEAAGSGDLVSRATDDVSVVGTAIGQALPALSTSVFTVVVSIAALGAIDWRFLVVVVVATPLYVYGIRLYRAHAPAVYAAERASIAGRAHHVLAAIRGIDTVRSFDLSRHLGAGIARHSWDVVIWSMRARFVQNRLWGRMNTAEFLGMSTILVVGYLLVDRGSLTVGATTTAMLLFLRLFDPIGGLLMVFDELQSAFASLARIVGVIDAADTEEPVPHRDEPEAGVRIRLDNISFGYRDGHTVLDSVSLSVADGEHVAIVGGSGAGKTTLAAIIAGIHHPRSGEIAVAAQRPVMVAQEVHVFCGTVAEDLRIAAPDADDKTIEQALKTIGAYEWVMQLPEGIQTVVGTDGHALTPMQAQHLAMARIVLADPDLVILDEATAEAGSTGAAVLEDAAVAAIRGRTALIIAHRLTQAEVADRVVVLDRGQIVEEGHHDHLVRLGGVYARLWSAWARYRQDAR